MLWTIGLMLFSTGLLCLLADGETAGILMMAAGLTMPTLDTSGGYRG